MQIRNAVLYLVLFLFTKASLGLDLTKLIKVNNENNPNCISYYQYKGSLYCSTSSSQPHKPNPNILDYERQQIVFDNRAWVAAWAKNTGQMITVEYVPEGQNINDWQELITSQFAEGLQKKVSPLQFCETIVLALEQSGFKPKITFFEKTNDRIIFEFQIHAPEHFQQDELQMITRGQKGIYILHYVIKQTDMGEANRKLWLSNFKATTPKEI
ncbi:hypothetical protein [Legionella jordanis]|uniref:Uncharacterized protein n=1 Tax=Legionella jordanis TaxID=456 RepID=A0A0W0V7J3_9GAMM|nr:hypothetical protein [Legionella jordanis]KTD16091.1 hypothetical protein Ljor_0397 [Legionella jordanis]RMX04677.1 hypothetical protein EAW55_04380 [Legionella jordanis]RMX18386.1 hypothetical protein EAS68_08565 [Legionella jordanis]VEH12449.1 Uncharacterised protein [Legionella jordanis]HAT8713960.1 hypothetical protein [Legionella jordanis]